MTQDSQVAKISMSILVVPFGANRGAHQLRWAASRRLDDSRMLVKRPCSGARFALMAKAANEVSATIPPDARSASGGTKNSAARLFASAEVTVRRGYGGVEGRASRSISRKRHPLQSRTSLCYRVRQKHIRQPAKALWE